MADTVTITYNPNWRASYWDTWVASRPAWFVTCADHPDVGKQHGEPWGYFQGSIARSVAMRHERAYHNG